MSIMRRIVPPICEWVLYASDSLPQPKMDGLDVSVAGSGRRIQPEEKRMLLRHIPAFKLWRFLKSFRRGAGWIYFASSQKILCHYTFVTPARLYQRMFPGKAIADVAVMLGPCLTEEAFRGQAIYPRMLCYVVGDLKARGLGPFFVYTNPGNVASIRGIEKAGFTQCGVWRGQRFLLDLRIVSSRVR